MATTDAPAPTRTGPLIVAAARQVTPDRTDSSPFRTPVTIVVHLGAGRNNVTANRRGVPMLPEASIARYST